LLSGDIIRCEANELYSVDTVESPLVYTVPHAGVLVPADLVETWGLGDDALRDTDLHTDELYMFEGSRVETSLNRYAVNMNRPRWRETGVSTYEEEDALRTYLKEMRPSWSKPVSDTWKQGLLGVYDAYHAALQSLLRDRIDSYGYVFLVTCHSMNAEADANTPDEGRRPDITICTEHGRGTSSAVIEAICDAIPPRYDVAVDDPYASGFTTAAYAAGDPTVHGVQIEVNKACYMDEETFTYDVERGRRLQGVLQQSVQAGLAVIRELED